MECTTDIAVGQVKEVKHGREQGSRWICAPPVPALRPCASQGPPRCERAGGKGIACPNELLELQDTHSLSAEMRDPRSQLQVVEPTEHK